MNLAFKCVTSDFKSFFDGTQYELYKTYTITNEKPLSEGGDAGYYFSDSLTKLFNSSFRSFDHPIKSKNRCFIIEVLSPKENFGNQSMSKSIRFLKEITFDLIFCYKEIGDKYDTTEKLILNSFVYPEKEIETYNYYFEKFKTEFTDEQSKRLTKKKSEEQIMKRNLHLDLVKKLQTKYPELIIGGSVALFLHGLRLDRWTKDSSDLDFISPYFVKVSDIELFNISYVDEKGEDVSNPQRNEKDQHFIEKFYFVSPSGYQIKFEMAVDPKSKYEIIEYEGFKYKVNELSEIWYYKLLYNRVKDKKDLAEAMNIKK